MAWQSPYRGEQSPLDGLSPRAKSMISRGVMLGVGLVLAYLAARSFEHLNDFASAPATQPAGTSPPRQVVPVFPLLLAIVCGFVGALMIAGAVLPVRAVERLVETFGRPPTTGDRSPHTDDNYNLLGSRPRRGGHWWWDQDD